MMRGGSSQTLVIRRQGEFRFLVGIVHEVPQNARLVLALAGVVPLVTGVTARDAWAYSYIWMLSKGGVAKISMHIRGVFC